MANLAAYIDFTIIMSKAQVSPIIKITDPNQYPMGVGATAFGYFTIRQPDGISVTFGSFASPSIFWSFDAFIQPEFELRLNTVLSFQNGGYMITYYLRASGYDDTTLTKTFTLSYSRPVLSVSHVFDIFTPALSATDSTAYTQSGMTVSSNLYTWEVDIISVEGTTQTIGGSLATIALAYLGDYYDSRYDITLTSNPQYNLEAPADWVNVIDDLELSTTLYAQIPQTIEELDLALQALKDESDAAAINCNTGTVLKERYIYANALYSDFRRKGCDNEIAGLTKTYFQLIKLFNNDVNPTYENTNEIIPAYDFQCAGTGAVNWDNIINKPNTELIEWTVGAVGFPGVGATTLTDARLNNVTDDRVILVRNGIPQFASDQGDGDSYFTKVTTDSFLTFFAALTASEKIIVIILPL